MNESKLKRDYHNINNKVINNIANIIKNGDITDEANKEAINEYLRNTDYDYCNCIGEYIASLFGVDRCDMFSKDKSVTLVHARTLWFLAMRFMMHKSYREIAIMVSLEDVSWAEQSIIEAVRRIQDELKVNMDLQYKWDIIKKMIYLSFQPLSYDNPFSDTIGYKVRVFKPRNVEVEVVEE